MNKKLAIPAAVALVVTALAILGFSLRSTARGPAPAPQFATPTGPPLAEMQKRGMEAAGQRGGAPGAMPGYPGARQ